LRVSFRRSTRLACGPARMGREYVSIARTNRKGHLKRFAVPVEFAAAIASALTSTVQRGQVA
jgi:hypothetical protein